MKLLLDYKELALLLERNRSKIGNDKIEGIDTVFSGLSFFASTVFASYADFGPVSGSFVRSACFCVSAAFAAWGYG